MRGDVQPALQVTLADGLPEVVTLPETRTVVRRIPGGKWWMILLDDRGQPQANVTVRPAKVPGGEEIAVEADPRWRNTLSDAQWRDWSREAVDRVNESWRIALLLKGREEFVVAAQKIKVQTCMKWPAGYVPEVMQCLFDVGYRCNRPPAQLADRMNNVACRVIPVRSDGMDLRLVGYWTGEEIARFQKWP
jgi:hypothetical protein